MVPKLLLLRPGRKLGNSLVISLLGLDSDVLVKIGDLVFHYLRVFADLNLHVPELQSGVRYQEVVLKDLMKMGRGDHLWRIVPAQEVFEDPARQTDAIYCHDQLDSTWSRIPRTTLICALAKFIDDHQTLASNLLQSE